MAAQIYQAWRYVVTINLWRLVFWFYWLIIQLPRPWLMTLGSMLGRVAMGFTPRRVHIADTNLRLCFPDLSPKARRILVQQHFESMGMGVMDIGLAWWASTTRIRKWVRIVGAEHAEAAFNQGRGVIFLTGHFTSIEMGARALLDFGTMYPVYRVHQNMYIDLLVREQRERHTGLTIPRHDMRLLLKTLKERKAIWFAPDQNFGNKNYVFSSFFGIPAATAITTSRLAQLSNATVIPFAVFRHDRGYEVSIGPALDNFPSGSVQLDTDRVNVILERYVRRYPAQYLWSHRRFKDRPDGEAGFY